MARFAVNYTIHGRATDIVEATSLAEAIAMIEAKVDRDDFHIDLDDVDDVDFDVAEMHPVTREGREIWTTYVQPGDIKGHASSLAVSPLFGSEVA